MACLGNMVFSAKVVSAMGNHCQRLWYAVHESGLGLDCCTASTAISRAVSRDVSRDVSRAIVVVLLLSFNL